MRPGLIILSAMLSTLLSTGVSAATCRLKVMLASGAVFMAESVRSSDGWTFIHLGGGGLIGVPDSHVLSTAEDCAPPVEVPTGTPAPPQVMTSPEAGLPAEAPARSDQAPEAPDGPGEIVEAIAPDAGLGDSPRGLDALDKLRNRNNWWWPHPEYAQEDDLLRPEDDDRSINWLRSRNEWWWPHSSYAREDALLNRDENQDALHALRSSNSWWWPHADFAEEDELIGGRGRWP